jgi:hypothetical protein
MNNRQGLFLILGIAGSFAVSFLGLGLLWIGLPFPVQAVISLVFLLLAYGLGRFLKNIGTTLTTFAGAAPIGLLITQFRDQNDSHLKPVLLVLGWALGMFLGAWLGTKSNHSVVKNNSSD